MNYGEVRAQFSGLLNRRDITTALRDTFIQQTISRLQRDLRIPSMEKSVSVTIGTYNKGIVIPSDLLQLKQIVNSCGLLLEQTDLQRALQMEKYAGIPCVFSRQGGRYRLGPYPVTGDVLQIDYYAETAALAGDTDENTLTLIAPDLIIYGALSYACDYYLDGRAATFEGRYQNIKTELENQADADELTGRAAIQPAYRYCEED